MSTFDQTYSSVATARLDMPKLSEEFIKRYPNMASVFAGQMKDDGATFERWPSSIILFFDADRFKFVIKPKFSSRVAFGSGLDGVGGFAEIEQALELKHFEWKLSGGQKRS